MLDPPGGGASRPSVACGLARSASVAFDEYQEMLHQAANRLPQGVKVVVLADRGFIHTEAMTAITAQFGWHYRIRIKRNT